MMKANIDFVLRSRSLFTRQRFAPPGGNIFFHRLFPVLAVFMSVFCCAARPAGRIAVIQARSGYPEAEALSRFFEVDAYDNTPAALDRLAGSLPRYDAVVVGTLGNYEEPQDFKVWHDAWLAYLTGGGVLLVVDANYQSAVDSVIHHLGKAFEAEVETTGCAALDYDVSTTSYEERAGLMHFREHPLLTRPQPAAESFAAAAFGLWAHLKLPDGWENLIACPENDSFMAVRKLGSGTVALTSCAVIGRAPEAFGALLDNLIVDSKMRQAGWTLEAFTLRRTPDGDSIVLDLRFPANQPAPTGVLRLTDPADGNLWYEKAFTATGREQSFPVSPGGRTGADLALEIETPRSLHLARQVSIPQPLVFALNRSIVYPATRNKVSIVWNFADYLARAGYRAELRCNDRPVPVKPLDRNYALLELADLEPGTYEFRGTVLAPDGKSYFQTPADQLTVRADSPRFSLAPPKNRFAENGRKFFPLGLYHVSWSLPAEDRLACLEFAGRYGYNTLHVSCKQPEDPALAAFLDRAEALGVRVILEGVDDKLLTGLLDRKAIMGWNVTDEPDLSGVASESLASVYRKWQQLDPERLIYTVIVMPMNFARYRAVADVIANDYYPVSTGKIEKVNPVQTMLVEAMRADERIPLAVVQTFAFGEQPYSTPAEIRNMTYQALLADVSGLIFYTYSDNEFKLAELPEPLEFMKKLPLEIKFLEPFLLEGELIRLPDPAPAVYAGIWQGDGRQILAVVNANRHAAAVNLPLSGRKNLEPLFGSSSPGPVRNGVLPLELDSLEVFLAELK